MKNWKIVLGLAGACAVCCSVPLAAGVAALAGAASGALVLLPELVGPAAALVVAISAFALIGVRRRAQATASPAACGCNGGCPAAEQPGGR